MKYLLDTCVISELTKKIPNLNVLKWLKTVPESSLFLSVITFGEITKGIYKLEDSKRKEILTNWVNKELYERFSGKILELDLSVLKKWGEITASYEKKGLKIPVVDSLLAVQAIDKRMVLVTRNISDIKIKECEVFNPWEIK